MKCISFTFFKSKPFLSLIVLYLFARSLSADGRWTRYGVARRDRVSAKSLRAQASYTSIHAMHHDTSSGYVHQRRQSMIIFRKFFVNVEDVVVWPGTADMRSRQAGPTSHSNFRAPSRATILSLFASHASWYAFGRKRVVSLAHADGTLDRMIRRNGRGCAMFAPRRLCGPRGRRESRRRTTAATFASRGGEEVGGRVARDVGDFHASRAVDGRDERR